MDENMDNVSSGNKAKFWFWVLAAIIIIGALWWIYKAGSGSKPASQPANQAANNQPAVPKITTKEVAKDQLPDSWPSDIPMETGAKVTVNYQRTAPDGSVQLVRTFISSKTLDANAKIYTDYFTSAGFKLGGSINQPAFKSYSATKGNEILQVLIQQDSKTKAVSVNITVTFVAKPF